MSLSCVPTIASYLFSSTSCGVAGAAVAQNAWSVNYTQIFICAVRGSTVTMGCSYKHNSTNSTNSINSTNSTVQSFFWSKYFLDPLDLSSDPIYSGRVRYLRATPHDCSLKIENVTQQDQRKYYATFRIGAGEVFQDNRGVDLSVTGELHQAL